MFEYYTFGAPARHVESRDARDVSPHDTSFRFPTLPSPSPKDTSLPGPISDLVSQLESHDFRHEVSQSDHAPSRSFRGEPSPSSTNNRRAQRQLHMRLQCEQSHMRSITALVEDMLKKESQCTIRRRTPSPSPPPQLSYLLPEDDELSEDGTSSETSSSSNESEHGISLREAAGPAGIRKHDGLRTQYRGSSYVPAQRVAVHCPPRMRKSGITRKRSA